MKLSKLLSSKKKQPSNNKNNFLKKLSISLAIGVFLPTLITAPKTASAVEPATVMMAINITGALFSLFGENADPTAETVQANFELIKQLHNRLDGFERTIGNMAIQVALLPKVFRELLRDSQNELLNQEVTGYGKSFKLEAMSLLANIKYTKTQADKDRYLKQYDDVLFRATEFLRDKRQVLMQRGSTNALGVSTAALLELGMYKERNLIGQLEEAAKDYEVYFLKVLDAEQQHSLPQMISQLEAIIAKQKSELFTMAKVVDHNSPWGKYLQSNSTYHGPYGEKNICLRKSRIPRNPGGDQLGGEECVELGYAHKDLTTYAHWITLKQVTFTPDLSKKYPDSLHIELISENEGPIPGNGGDRLTYARNTDNHAQFNQAITAATNGLKNKVNEVNANINSLVALRVIQDAVKAVLDRVQRFKAQIASCSESQSECHLPAINTGNPRQKFLRETIDIHSKRNLDQDIDYFSIFFNLWGIQTALADSSKQEEPTIFQLVDEQPEANYRRSVVDNEHKRRLGSVVDNIKEMEESQRIAEELIVELEKRIKEAHRKAADAATIQRALSILRLGVQMYEMGTQINKEIDYYFDDDAEYILSELETALATAEAEQEVGESENTEPVENDRPSKSQQNSPGTNQNKPSKSIKDNSVPIDLTKRKIEQDALAIEKGVADFKSAVTALNGNISNKKADELMKQWSKTSIRIYDFQNNFGRNSPELKKQDNVSTDITNVARKIIKAAVKGAKLTAKSSAGILIDVVSGSSIGEEPPLPPQSEIIARDLISRSILNRYQNDLEHYRQQLETKSPYLQYDKFLKNKSESSFTSRP